jgi:hypothetical protein
MSVDEIRVRPDSGDDFESVEALMAGMNDLIRQGYAVFPKWTCPKCGERVTSGEPNVFHSQGYYHDAPGCGALYTGTRYGLMAIAMSDKEALAKLLVAAYQSQPEFEGDLPGYREKGGPA